MPLKTGAACFTGAGSFGLVFALLAAGLVLALVADFVPLVMAVGISVEDGAGALDITKERCGQGCLHGCCERDDYSLTINPHRSLSV